MGDCLTDCKDMRWYSSQSFVVILLCNLSGIDGYFLVGVYSYQYRSRVCLFERD